jgi:hypothetical protein
VSVVVLAVLVFGRRTTMGAAGLTPTVFVISDLDEPTAPGCAH